LDSPFGLQQVLRFQLLETAGSWRGGGSGVSPRAEALKCFRAKLLKAPVNFSCRGVEGVLLTGNGTSRWGAAVVVGQHNLLPRCKFVRSLSGLGCSVSLQEGESFVGRSQAKCVIEPRNILLLCHSVIVVW